MTEQEHQVEGRQDDTPVAGDLSDLFFNRDVEHCKVFDAQGTFMHFDYELLVDEANQFLENMKRLGTADLPTNRAIVNDFLKRV